jgi:hypothetical protein
MALLPLLVGTALATAPPTERKVAVGVGAFFNAGGTFMTQPSDLSHPQVAELPFSGWAGFSPGGGVSFDVRFFDAIGLEIDVIRSVDQAQSEYTINNTDVRFGVRTPAWHIPILLKAGIPSNGVSPNIFLGALVVAPGEVDFPDVPGVPWEMTAQTSTYTRFMFGLGFEGRLPIDDVDIRIPFAIRGALAPGYPAAATDRATYDITPDNVLLSMDYDLRWQYHAGVTLGVAYYFL